MSTPSNLPMVSASSGSSDSSACGCGCSDDGVPRLDVRSIPHAIRHATVFGALQAIPVGHSLELVAPHDPKPLLAQIATREAGVIAVRYLVEGPEAWTLRLTRTR